MLFIQNKISLQNLCIASLFFFIPITGIGIYVNNFLINALLLPLTILSLVFIFFKKLDLKIFLSITCMLMFFLISVVGRHSPSTFVPSFIVTLVLVSPLALVIRADIFFIEKLFRKSLYIILIITFFEFLITRTFPLIWIEVEKVISLQGASVDYFGSRRLRGAFIEPSIFGMVLNYYYICALFFKDKGFDSYRILMPIIALLIFLSFSSAAYLTLIGIISIQIIFKISKLRSIRKFSINPLLIISFILIATIFSAIIYPYLDASFKAFERLANIGAIIETQTTIGSVAYRLVSILLGPLYLIEATGINFFFGEGFSNYQTWIIDYFPYNPASPFADGSIGNLFSAVIISTGLFGFLSFAIFFLAFSKPFYNKFYLIFTFLNAMFFLSYANFTSPVLWGIMLLTRIVLESIKREGS